nr:hypothetical protein KK1_022158 [Ipomoea batatas]
MEKAKHKVASNKKVIKVCTRNAGSAVNKNKDHSTKGPSNAKNANTAAGISASDMRVCLALVSYHCENSDVEEQKSSNKLSYDGPVKRPLTQLLRVNEGCWWGVLDLIGDGGMVMECAVK